MCSSLLVVDDELGLRKLLTGALSDAGYDIAVVRDGAQAISLLECPTFAPDAVITDLNLGQGPDGWQVAQRAQQRRPGVPVIYITGGRGQDPPPAGAPEGVFLLKPFTVEQLLVVTEELLTS